MPSYFYICNDCKKEWKVFHGVDEKEQKCTFCSSESIQKNFNSEETINLSGSTRSNELEKARDRIEKYIEESRTALKEQLAEARKEIK